MRQELFCCRRSFDISDRRAASTPLISASQGFTPFFAVLRPVARNSVAGPVRYHCIYSSLPAFRPSAKLVPPTMPSADFCAAVRPPCDDLSPVAETQRRPPEVRQTAFTARPPNLPPRSLMTVDFAISCSLVRPGRPRYPVFVHRAAALLHASFRPHLAMMPLRFANPSPPSGWIEDFHLQAVGHARHTTKTPRLSPRGFRFDRRCAAQCARIASSSSATMLVILIIGLTAGPAVSL
jgi:hypothetical protein